jgi:hypothetical protein
LWLLFDDCCCLVLCCKGYCNETKHNIEKYLWQDWSAHWEFYSGFTWREGENTNQLSTTTKINIYWGNDCFIWRQAEGTFQRYDTLLSKVNPFGLSELQTIFLKVSFYHSINLELFKGNVSDAYWLILDRLTMILMDDIVQN